VLAAMSLAMHEFVSDRPIASISRAGARHYG
jgi:hypothetical protein